MTKEEATKYYRAVMGRWNIPPEQLLEDPRGCHAIAHGCGLFPADVEDDVEFFKDVLRTLVEAKKQE